MYKRGECWYTEFWHDGTRYKKSWGAIGKTAARERENKFRTEVLEGKHRQRARRIRFETLTEKYLEHAKTNLKPKTAKRYEVSIEMLKPHFGGTPIQAVHPFMVEKYKRDRIEAGAAPGTVNRDLATLRNMLNMAVEWGYLHFNPLKKVRHLAEDSECMWVIGEKEEAALLKECAARPQREKYLVDLVLFALNTGMRQGEIFGLKWGQIDRRLGYIHVTDTKTHQSRKVPMNAIIREIVERREEQCRKASEKVTGQKVLERQKDHSQKYVFTNHRGKRLTVLTNAYWAAVAKAKLVRTEKRHGKEAQVRFRFHDLRHTFGSRLGESGVDLKTIMEIMGHRTTKMAMRYQHPSPSHKQAAVEKLENFFHQNRHQGENGDEKSEEKQEACA